MEKTIKGKLFCLTLTTLILFVFATVTFVSGAFGAVAASGTCGADLTWSFDDNRTITISGIGDMDDYGVGGISEAPWSGVASGVKVVVVDDGASSIGAGAFVDCGGLTSITVPDSVVSIGQDVFADYDSLVISCYRDSYIYDYAVNNGISYVLFDADLEDNASFNNDLWIPDMPDPLPDNDSFIPTLFAMAVTASGECGENLTWTLEDGGTLTISGTGDMANYSFHSYVPWYSYSSSIREVMINNGGATRSPITKLA